MTKKKIFLDTNVVLDFVLKREGFVDSARTIFQWHEMGKVQIYVSTLTLANTAYIVKKNGRDPFLVVSELIKWVEVIPLELMHFQSNITSSFKDFEDGLQYFSALETGGIEIIITRNSKDFRPSAISVLTPKDFIKMMQE